MTNDSNLEARLAALEAEVKSLQKLVAPIVFDRKFTEIRASVVELRLEEIEAAQSRLRRSVKKHDDILHTQFHRHSRRPR